MPVSKVNDPCNPSSVEASAWFAPRRFLFFLLLLFVVAFRHVLIFGQSFFIRDFGLFGYPIAFFHKECFWKGTMPLWNPYNDCGLPFLAQWNTLTLYPGSLIYLLLPMPWSVSFFCVAHLFLASVGMYFLISDWLKNSFVAAFAAIAFAFNGLALNCLMWPNNVAAIGLMPWVILFTQKAWQRGGRTQIVAVFFTAAQILAGAPEMILFTWIINLVLWTKELVENKSERAVYGRRLVSLIVISSGLCAVQLIPFFELVAHSQRSENFSENIGVMPLSGWLNLSFPLFHFFPSAAGIYFQPNQFWTTSYYSGIVIVALAAIGLTFRERKLNLLLGLVAIAIVMALGDSGFLYKGIRLVFPQLGFFRFPIKFVVPAIFGLIVAASFVLAKFTRADSNRQIFSARTAIIFAGFALLALFTAWLSFRHPVGEESWKTVIKNNALRLLFLCVFCVFVFLWNRINNARTQVVLACGALIVLWLDGITHVPWQNPTLKGAYLQPDLAAAQFNLPPQAGSSRLMLSRPLREHLFYSMFEKPEQDVRAHRLAFNNNYNLLDHVPKVNGFFSLHLKEYSVLYDRFARTNFPPDALLDFLAVSYGNNPTNFNQWQERSTYLPVISGGQKPVFTNDAAALQGILSPEFNPRQMVFLPEEAKNIFPSEKPMKMRTDNIEFDLQRVAFDIETTSATTVVISQAFYPAWKAYVDNIKAPLVKADYAFQAVPVPAGRHHVELVYEDTAFNLGAIISCVTLVFCLAWVIRMPGERHARNDSLSSPIKQS